MEECLDGDDGHTPDQLSMLATIGTEEVVNVMGSNITGVTFDRSTVEDEMYNSNLGMALTTIISYFVVSSGGLTKSRVDILLKLLLELSDCDDEIDSAIPALQQVLLALGSDGTLAEPAGVVAVPSLVYDPIAKLQRAAQKSMDIPETNNCTRKTPKSFSNNVARIITEHTIHPTHNVNVVVPFGSNTKVSEIVERNGKIVVLAETDKSVPLVNEARFPSDSDDLGRRSQSVVKQYPIPNTHGNDAMQSIFSNQRNIRRNEADQSKALSFDLCLWCNQLIASNKTKEHSSSNHRSIEILEVFNCPICSCSLSDNYAVADHIRSMPTCVDNYIESTPIKCVLCMESFVGSAVIREHYIVFHHISDDRGERRIFWSCMYCGISEHSKYSLASHIKVYHITRSPHFCRFCGVKYMSLLILHKHLIIRHRQNLGDTLYDYYALVSEPSLGIEDCIVKETWCSYCDDEFTSESNFNTHVTDVHYCSARNQYLCALCNSTFDNSTDLSAHVLKLHLIGGHSFYKKCLPAKTKRSSATAQPVTVSCPICFVESHNKNHIKETHTLKEILHYISSQLCINSPQEGLYEKSSTLHNLVKTFLLPHESSNKNTCKLCGKVSASLTYYFHHFTEQHCGNQEYVCAFCFRTFDSRGTLQNHERRHHLQHMRKRHCSGGSEPQQKPTYQCNHCVYTSIRPDHLEEHVKAKHLKTRDNQCNICSSSFSRKRDLRRHFTSKHSMAPIDARDLTEQISPDPKGQYKRRWGKYRDMDLARRKKADNDTSALPNPDLSNSELSNPELPNPVLPNPDLFVNTDFINISVVGNLDKD